MRFPEDPKTRPDSGAPEPTAPLAFVARQAIYDAASNVVAYELLYRHAETAITALVVDDVQATLHVIVNTALEIGLERLSGKLPVHINYPTELLAAAALPPFPAERVVIEVLESVRFNAAILGALGAFRAQGFHIALDDFDPRLSDPALLEWADTVKLDISRFPNAQLADRVRMLKQRGVRLIAERVESASEFELCRTLGFDAFQGPVDSARILGAHSARGDCV